MKDSMISIARKLGHEVTDLGTCSTDSVDYPDIARLVAEALQSGRAERAVLICGSGIGACVAANTAGRSVRMPLKEPISKKRR